MTRDELIIGISVILSFVYVCFGLLFFDLKSISDVQQAVMGLVLVLGIGGLIYLAIKFINFKRYKNSDKL